MTLRAGRADLHQRLTAEVEKIRATLPRNRDFVVSALLHDAAEAVLHCPHLDCAFCYAVEQQEITR